MTIILGLKIENDEGEKASSLDDYLILATDSMASYQECHVKCDDDQKLYLIGQNKDFLLMGAGLHEGVDSVVKVIESSPFNSLQEIAEKILAVTEQFKSQYEKEIVDFIVAGRYLPEGKSEPELGFVEVSATGYSPGQMKPRWAARGFSIKPGFTIDGSGAGYALSYIQGLQQTGKEYKYDITDAFVLAYEFSKRGARDSGVNEKLQFGLVTKDGVSSLYHPETMLHSEQAFVNYLNLMSGLDFPLSREDLPAGEQRRKMLRNRSDLHELLNIFYDQFTSDLREYADCRRMYTTYSEMYANDESAKDDFEEMRARRIQAKKDVWAGVDALMKKGLPAIFEYVANFDERKKQLSERVSKLPDEHKKQKEK